MTQHVQASDAARSLAPRRPNLQMWGRALAGIPRLVPGQWQALDPVARWLIASRSGVLVLTLIPCTMAGVLAMRAGAFDLRLFSLVTLGLLLAHATNNLLNDLTDYLKGVDRGNYFRARYGPQPLEHGLLSVRQSLTYIVATGGVALLIGGYLVTVRGGLTLELLGAGAFFVLFYTWPLKYFGLGELAVIVVWGPLILGGAYYVITGSWDWQVATLSLVYGFGATSVIFGKHIDKLAEDREREIRTLPVLLGDRAARAVGILLMVLPYVVCLYLILTGYTTPVLLVVLLALPRLRQAIGVFRRPRPTSPPDGYPESAWPLWYVSFAFVHNRAFGALFLLGLLADVMLDKLLLS